MRISAKKALKVSFWIGLLFASGVLLFVALVYFEAFGSIPNEKELSKIKNANASLVYSEDGVLLGQYFSENRTNVPYRDFPSHLIEALVSTEDTRFFEHDGIDERSLVRVLVRSILMGDKSGGGGSTITQQLAKNLFGRPSFGFLTLPVNKTKEMILAQRLEHLYGKEQILELYLNTVSFSENTFGIGAGSRRFFGKLPNELRIEESAVLIGLLKANTYYNPRLYPEHALQRRNVVLHQMHTFGNLSASAKDSLQQLPLKLNYQNLANNSRAPYFLSYLKPQISKHLEAYNEANGTDLSLDTDGLTVSTTLNMSMQEAAEKAMNEHMSQLQQRFDDHWNNRNAWVENEAVFEAALRESRVYKNWKESGLSEEVLEKRLRKKHPVQLFAFGKDTVLNISSLDSIRHYIQLLNAAFFAAEPKTGAVRAYVGGIDHQFLPYNHVQAKRQAASTFKPFIYATALEQGENPCVYYKNELRTYEEYEGWTPKNYDNTYEGYYSMAGALKKSVNVAAVQAIFNAGVTNVLVQARKMGIESSLPDEPSLALGTGSVTLQEMVQGYGVFANEGIRQPHYFITSITGPRGEVIYQHKLAQPKSVMRKGNAQAITEMLRGVVDEGTGASLRTVYGLRVPLAGKTGTAQNYTDGWFIGYTPNLVAGVWVGASSPAVHFRTGTYGSGSKMALPVFGKFFQNLKSNPKVYQQATGTFEPLNSSLQNDLNCPDFKEDNLVEDIKQLFKKKEGKKVKDADEDKPGFFKRLFGKDKKE